MASDAKRLRNDSEEPRHNDDRKGARRERCNVPRVDATDTTRDCGSPVEELCRQHGHSEGERRSSKHTGRPTEATTGHITGAQQAIDRRTGEAQGQDNPGRRSEQRPLTTDEGDGNGDLKGNDNQGRCRYHSSRHIKKAQRLPEGFKIPGLLNRGQQHHDPSCDRCQVDERYGDYHADPRAGLVPQTNVQ